MSEPILSQEYWSRRLEQASELHHAVFRCPLDRWKRIEAKHREILARHIRPLDHVLDAGCAWGRLLDLMPADWQRSYIGIDLSPAFIELARKTYPAYSFLVGDLRSLDIKSECMDWAILISIRPMVKRNLGDDEWARMDAELRRVAKRRIFLEYDENDEGSVE